MKQLCDLIDAYMLRKNLTYRELAPLLGVDHVTVWKWRDLNRMPRWHRAVAQKVFGEPWAEAKKPRHPSTWLTTKPNGTTWKNGVRNGRRKRQPA